MYKGNNTDIPHSDSIPAVSPLSEVQLGIYLECVGKPDNTLYNVPVMLDIPQGTDKLRLYDAIKTVFEKHKILSVKIGSPEGVPSMIPVDREIVFEETESDNAEADFRFFSKPFDLENGPLYRFRYVSCPGGDVLMIDIHHIIIDGTSYKILLHQISDAYFGKSVPDEELTLFDVAKAEKTPSSDREEAIKEFNSYFENKFGGADCDSKPVPDCVISNDSNEWGIVTREITDTDSVSAISRFVGENEISENALFLGAFGYALARFNGVNQSAFVTANTGRRDRRLSGTVGMFVKTLPFLCSFDENMSPAEYLAKVYDDYYITKQNDCISFAELAARYGLNMNVSFIYQSELFDAVRLGNGTTFIDLGKNTDSVSDIEVMFFKTEKGYRADCRYCLSDYTAGFAESFTGMFINVILGMTCVNSLRDIYLVDEKAFSVIESNNRTEKTYEYEKTVVELFREQTAKIPDAVCLVYEEKNFTYSEIDRITDNLARYLLSLGIGKGTVTGVLIPRSEYMLICSLGVLKAGGAYMPLDPTYPPERLNLMMTDSGASLLITTPELNGIISDEYTGLRMMTAEILTLKEESTPLPVPDKDDLFIMLYTSGSTGVPKGVMFAHSNIMVTSAWQRDFYDLGPGCCVTAYASYGFDANAFDTYATITSGAALHIISDELRLDLPALQQYFNENKITHATMTTQVGRQFAVMGGSDYLRYLNVAGEKLTPVNPPEGFKLYNLYGPTEGSILATGFHVDKLYKDVPIGKPLDNVKLYVVDPCCRLLPPGAVGELWISGVHVTKGYLNRPEKTAEAYGENPFCNDAGYDRVYRTGDIVRLMSDGNYQFIGRRDGQVKVRGFRVELTEVEEIIRRFDGIDDATVAAFDDSAGGKFLAAYVVSDKEIDVTALNEFIRSKKPPYMVPAVTMQIDKIPLNQNQKVNKKALPVPERKAENVILPQNEVQQRIYDIIADIIGQRSFGIDTDLFEAGLTSIGSLMLNVSLGKEFNTSVKLEDIKKNSTVIALEAMLSDSAEVITYEKLGSYPITQTQMGIFVECSSMPDTVTYNMPVLVKLGENVDTDRLVSALKTAVNAHPYIKTTLFSDENGDILARRNDGDEPLIDLIKCKSVPEADELVTPFNLLNAPLYRISVYKTDEGNYLFMDIHHIISDGMSETVILSDIDRAYSGKQVIPESYTGFEAALDEKAERESGRLSEAKAYYDSVFKGCESDSLPPKAPELNKNGAEAVSRILNADAKKISDFCKANNYTLNAFFNAAFGFALSRFGQFEDVIFSTIYNGRNDSRLASSVTMLVKTIPVLVHTEGSVVINDVIAETQRQLVNSMANSIYSFAEISAAYGIRSDILFIYQGDNFVFTELCGEPAEFISVLPSVGKVPLSINVFLENGKFRAEAEYRCEMYNQPFVENLLDVFERTVSGFAEKEKAEEISLLSESADRLFSVINNTARPFENKPVNSFVEKYAALTPERTAIVAQDAVLTYSELNSLANRMAHVLYDLGVKKDSVVGLMLDRVSLLSVTELAIIKSGGAFLGLLPEYPDDRAEYCLIDAGSPFVITTAEIKASRPSLFGDDKPYRTLTVEEMLENKDETNLNLDVAPGSLVYCIYTSGSTGNPKGVMIEHHNLANCAQSTECSFECLVGENSGSTCVALCSITFDVSVLDNLIMLMNGKTVCIASGREIHNPELFADLMERNKVDTIVGTPSFFVNMLGFSRFRSAAKNLKVLLSGGEAFPAAMYDDLKSINPDINIINGYGPSETTILCGGKLLESSRNISIGGPYTNTEYYVLDKFGNILPPYACGELIICGELVGRGYMNLPERTSQSFFTLRGKRAYHSGDIVRFNDEGEIEFFGRKDNQVKLRGFRVELDEIEKCFCTYEGVVSSKVVVRNNGSEDFLAGFFTADRQIDIADLSEHLKSKLTYYMVPDAIMQLDSMPLTVNGKIDKKALPEIKKEAKKSGRKAPKKSLEEQLCDLFKSVLSVDEFYADDNFFEMGGTSLSASKVTMQLMSKGIRVEYQDIFTNPTPEELASYIESLKTEKITAEKKEDEKPGSDYDDILNFNSLSFASEAVREPLGDVLLTGAVGFLGVHILKELIDRKEGKVICLVRRGNEASPEIRLKNMLMYYFSDTFESEFTDTISVIESDITDDNLNLVLADVHYDTLINCAACVKHYASDDIIEKINVHGVENLIVSAKEKNARMIQISTTSVPGVHTDDTWKRQVTMHENELFVIDDMDNKYCISKYHAEQKMFDAIRNGLRGKVIRVGNLMGRHSDGEFQINFNTNAFMNALRGFVTIGKCPISHATDPMSFSPIDLTARAIVLLAGTNDKFTAFHADNRFGFDEYQLIEAANNCGLTVTPVPDEEYYADYYRMLGDEKINSRLQGLVTNDRPDLHAVEVDNIFTANVLYRLGFAWPLVDSSYLERAIESLLTLDYFEFDEE